MIIHELRILFKSLALWAVLVIVLSFFFFLPLVGGDSPVIIVFQSLKDHLVPAGVELIVTDPLSGFLAQAIVALSLAFLASFPILLYEIVHYLSPALEHQEKRALGLIILPSLLLFFGGCWFAYSFIVPATFKMLFPFALSIEAVPFFLVDQFIQLVFGITIATGVLFLLPVFMVLLSSVGVVPREFWLKNWRYASVIFLAFSAIITPDGTGITMLLLTAPLSGLYLVGSFLSPRTRGHYQYNN